MAIDPLFSNETTDNIHKRMLQRIDKKVDKREGSITHDFTRYPSIEFEQLYMELDNVLRYGFAQTSYGQFLQLRAAEVGLIPKPAVHSTGRLYFSGPIGTPIPKGTQVTDELENIIVETTEDIVIQSDTIPEIVWATSLKAGDQKGALEDTLTVLKTPIEGAKVTVYNEEQFSDGHNAETDEGLKIRYGIRTKQIVAPGNEVYYRLLAVSVPGVLDARIYPRWQGRGTVRIVCLSPNKKAPSESVIANVKKAIGDGLLLGVDPTIEGVHEVPIDIDVKLTLHDYSLGTALSIENAANHIKPLLVDYFAQLAFNDVIIRYSRIGDALLDALPVLDYEDLRINGLTSNIVVKDDQVPVLGRLTITI